MSVFSVTEVRNALRCPRIFALGRAGGPSVAFPVGSSSLGAAFHRIVDRFTRTIASPPVLVAELGMDASRELVVQRISGWLMQHLVQELRTTPAYATMPAEVDDLAESLRELARYLADRIADLGGAPAPAMAALLESSEQDVSAELVEVRGTAVVVRGRIDSLHALGRGAIDVVEYKLTDEANRELDEAQVALYRALLRRSRGLDATPVVLRFAPSLTVTRLSPARADLLLLERLLPLLVEMSGWDAEPQQAPPTSSRGLCAGCPLRRRCGEMYCDELPARDTPPATGPRPTITPQGDLVPGALPEVPALASVLDAAGRAEAEELSAWVTQLLRRLGVNVTVRRAPEIGPRTIGLQVTAGAGQVRQLDRTAEDVVHYLKSEHDVTAVYERLAGVRRFVATRRTPRPVEMDQLVARSAAWLRARPGRFIVGEAPDGSVVLGDLSAPASCHLLVAGMTGSGKSVFLRTLLQSMTTFHSPAAIQFTLVDPKRVSFGSMLARGLGDYLAAPVCHDSSGALGEVEDLVEEMERRYALIEGANAEHIDEYNEDVRENQRLPHHVVVVDEFADLMYDTASRQPFETAVKRLGGKARAAGIHLVLATQRPEAKVVPGIIKANLSGKIALRVQSATDSRLILSQRGAEALLGGGDLLAELGRGIQRAQVPFVR